MYTIGPINYCMVPRDKRVEIRPYPNRELGIRAFLFHRYTFFFPGIWELSDIFGW